jgi:hypothetical protein
MAIIRCVAAADGSLTPQRIEFEPGDLVEFTSGEPTGTMEVDRAFSLDDLAECKNRLMVSLDVALDSAERPHIHPDPKLPPPPVADGAFLVAPTTGTTPNAIKVIIDRS